MPFMKSSCASSRCLGRLGRWLAPAWTAWSKTRAKKRTNSSAEPTVRNIYWAYKKSVRPAKKLKSSLWTMTPRYPSTTKRFTSRSPGLPRTRSISTLSTFRTWIKGARAKTGDCSSRIKDLKNSSLTASHRTSSGRRFYSLLKSVRERG